MIEWRRVPWSLWVYSAVSLTGMILVEIKASAPILGTVLFVAVILAWLYFLFRGVRWVWIVAVGIYGVGLILDLVSTPLQWGGVAVSLIGLVLLLLPVTRRYFSSHRATAGA